MVVNRQWILARRPKGEVVDGDLELVEAPVPALGEGEVLVRTVYLSVDPTNRTWMNDAEGYLPPVQIGEVMRGLTLGVVGLGKLGSAVARVGAAFGMKVIAWSQNLTEERAAEIGARRVDKATLFAEADVVTLHLILSDRSRGIVGAEDLARMKRTAFVVNTSRGPLIDQDALIAALNSGQIAGAGIDVYDHEPLPPGHPILSAPNTLLTPHLGYVTQQNYRAYYQGCVEAIEAFNAGAPVRVIAP